MIDKNEETAFPVPIGQTGEDRCGMSLRDWFAGKAMEAKLISGDYMPGRKLESAIDCYEWADAMMEARKEHKDPDCYEVKMSRWADIYHWASTNGLDNRRACNILARAGIDSFDKITHKALSDVRNCGVKTVDIIMDWKARKEANQ